MDEATFQRQFTGKLIDLRKRSGLSLADVATESGIGEDRLKRYEEGGGLPAVGELINLARVFAVSMNHFFSSELSEARVEVIRASERWKVKPQTDTAAALNYSYEALSYRLTDKMMSPFHIEIPPNREKKVEPLSHEGEEFLFILEGSVEITVGEDAYQLTRGDAIYFDSRQRHSVRALGACTVRMLACLANVHRSSSDSESPIQRAH